MEIFDFVKVKNENDPFEVRLSFPLEKTWVDRIKFINFDDFKKLKFWNFNISYYNFYVNYIFISFLPNKLTNFDISLKCVNLNFKRIKAKYIFFYYVKGFDVDLFGLEFCPTRTKTIQIIFSVSKFDLYKNNNILDKKKCKQVHYKQFFERVFFEKQSAIYGFRF